MPLSIAMPRFKSSIDDRQARTKQTLRSLSALYIIFIIYGSLIPWSGWRLPRANILDYFRPPTAQELSRKEFVANVLIYVPLGLLLVSSVGQPNRLRVIALATLGGGLFSFAMEALQAYVPSRGTSSGDVIANTAGTLLGATLSGLIDVATPLQRRIEQWREEVRPGDTVNAALWTLGVWVAAELSPFVPVLNRAELRANLIPAWRVLHRLEDLRLYQVAAYALYLAGLLLLVRMVTKPGGRAVWWFVTVAGCVLAVKPLVYKQSLWLEALAGYAVVLILSPLLLRWQSPASAAAVMLLAGFVLQEAEPRAGPLHRFNWLPFSEHRQVPLVAIGNILGTLWPFMALGCLAMLVFRLCLVRRVMLLGGLAVFAIVFTAEWWQTTLPGRYGDITTVMLAAAGWAVSWALSRDDRSLEEGNSPAVPADR